MAARTADASQRKKAARALCDSLIRKEFRCFVAAQHDTLIREYTQRKMKEATMGD